MTEEAKPRRSRSSAKNKLEDVAAAATETPAEPQTEQRPANGVLVIRNDDEAGGHNVSVQIIGNVRVTEVETLLKLGLKDVSQSLGI